MASAGIRVSFEISSIDPRDEEWQLKGEREKRKRERVREVTELFVAFNKAPGKSPRGSSARNEEYRNFPGDSWQQEKTLRELWLLI